MQQDQTSLRGSHFVRTSLKKWSTTGARLSSTGRRPLGPGPRWTEPAALERRAESCQRTSGCRQAGAEGQRRSGEPTPHSRLNIINFKSIQRKQATGVGPLQQGWPGHTSQGQGEEAAFATQCRRWTVSGGGSSTWAPWRWSRSPRGRSSWCSWSLQRRCSPLRRRPAPAGPAACCPPPARCSWGRRYCAGGRCLRGGSTWTREDGGIYMWWLLMRGACWAAPTCPFRVSPSVWSEDTV